MQSFALRNLSPTGCDAFIKQLTETDTERQQNHVRLCTITGLGPVVGSAVLNTLERVPLKSADCPSAGRVSYGACCTSLRWQQPKQRTGRLSTSISAQRVCQPLKHWLC